MGENSPQQQSGASTTSYKDGEHAATTTQQRDGVKDLLDRPLQLNTTGNNEDLRTLSLMECNAKSRLSIKSLSVFRGTSVRQKMRDLIKNDIERLLKSKTMGEFIKGVAVLVYEVVVKLKVQFPFDAEGTLINSNFVTL